MSDRAPSDCLLRSWMLRNIHEQKGGAVAKEIKSSFNKEGKTDRQNFILRGTPLS